MLEQKYDELESQLSHLADSAEETRITNQTQNETLISVDMTMRALAETINSLKDTMMEIRNERKELEEKVDKHIDKGKITINEILKTIGHMALGFIIPFILALLFKGGK